MLKYTLLTLFLSISYASASDFIESDFIEVKKESNVIPKGSNGICEKYTWFCEVKEGSETDFKTVKRINQKINRANSIEDIDQYGEIERWAILSDLGGDCEDYALTKQKELIDLGYDSRTFFIGIVKLKDQTAHGVLIWRTSNGDYVLDNLTNRIVKWNMTGYNFIAIQDPNNKTKWLITE